MPKLSEGLPRKSPLDMAPDVYAEVDKISIAGRAHEAGEHGDTIAGAGIGGL